MKNKNITLLTNDADHRVFSFSFSGRMTEYRQEVIKRYCANGSYQADHCGCEHDCCGHLTEQTMTFQHAHNLTTITVSQAFNY